MKSKIFFIFFIVASVWKAYGQNDYSHRNDIDSIRINYISLGEFLDVNVILKKDIVLFVSNWGCTNGALIYQTNSQDTIDYLYGHINTIADNPPIIDSSIIANDCCDGIIIYIYKGGNVCKKTYTNYAESYFPFAYAELYCLIRQFIAKYLRKD